MNQRQKICLLVMVFIVTGMFTAFYINTLTTHGEAIDLLFANRSHISAEGAEQFMLSQDDVTYEITPVGNNTFEIVGDLSDTKEEDGSGFGFRIYWNGTIPNDRIFLVIALKFPASLYPEKEFDFRAEFTVIMTHNVSFDYHFGACVSQLLFYPEPVVWPFEIFGTANGTGILELNTDYLDNESYMVIREGGIIEPMLTLDIPLEQGFITKVLLDYAVIEVFTQL